MNHYELLAIVDGRIADPEIEGFRTTIEETLKKHAAQIHYLHNLGRRKLAYPIKKQVHGTYLLCEFDAPTDAITKLERALALTTELLRHCIVRRKTVGSPIPLERREEEPRTRPLRKTQDDELLGRVPIEEEIARPPSAPSEARRITTQQPALQQQPREEIVLPVSDDTVASPEPESTPSLHEEEPKKKGQKASYEELDKKLNELLSDDIL